MTLLALADQPPSTAAGAAVVEALSRPENTDVAEDHARGGPVESVGAVVAALADAGPAVADAAVRKAVFTAQRAKCHTHAREGMAVHPKEELLVHILDPSRSVEGNFRVYTAKLLDGRVVQGCSPRSPARPSR